MNQVNGSQTQLKFAWHHFYPVVPSIWDKLSWEKSLLVRTEILGLFVNIWTADDKYSRHSRENFPQQFQMQLSQKQNFFVNFLLRFRNLHQILNILKK